MTGPNQRAFSYGAEGHKETAFNPATADKCFLCGNEISETAPRQFWGGKKGNAMLLAHTPCLNKFAANGYEWPDGENRLMDEQESQKLAVQYSQEHSAVPADEKDLPPASDIKASNVRFDTFADMQEFIAARGRIPTSANVFVGDQQVQAAQ